MEACLRYLPTGQRSGYGFLQCLHELCLFNMSLDIWARKMKGIFGPFPLLLVSSMGNMMFPKVGQFMWRWSYSSGYQLSIKLSSCYERSYRLNTFCGCIKCQTKRHYAYQDGFQTVEEEAKPGTLFKHQPLKRSTFNVLCVVNLRLQCSHGTFGSNGQSTSSHSTTYNRWSDSCSWSGWLTEANSVPYWSESNV